jgi:hypothetical protein
VGRAVASVLGAPGRAIPSTNARSPRPERRVQSVAVGRRSPTARRPKTPRPRRSPSETPRQPPRRRASAPPGPPAAKHPTSRSHRPLTSKTGR